MSTRVTTVLLVFGFALFFYLLAYALTVRPVAMYTSGVGPWRIPPDYQFFGRPISHRFIHAAFAPLHWLDERIRKDYWVVR